MYVNVITPDDCLNIKSLTPVTMVAGADRSRGSSPPSSAYCRAQFRRVHLAAADRQSCLMRAPRILLMVGIERYHLV